MKKLEAIFWEYFVRRNWRVKFFGKDGEREPDPGDHIGCLLFGTVNLLFFLLFFGIPIILTGVLAYFFFPGLIKFPFIVYYFIWVVYIVLWTVYEYRVKGWCDNVFMGIISTVFGIAFYYILINFIIH